LKPAGTSRKQIKISPDLIKALINYNYETLGKRRGS
jgi:hypothetical protein